MYLLIFIFIFIRRIKSHLIKFHIHPLLFVFLRYNLIIINNVSYANFFILKCLCHPLLIFFKLPIKNKKYTIPKLTVVYYKFVSHYFSNYFLPLCFKTFTIWTNIFCKTSTINYKVFFFYFNKAAKWNCYF